MFWSPIFLDSSLVNPLASAASVADARLEQKILKYDQNTKNLYGDYLRIAMTKIENRADQLRSLVIQVENCLKVLRKKVVKGDQGFSFGRNGCGAPSLLFISHFSQTEEVNLERRRFWKKMSRWVTELYTMPANEPEKEAYEEHARNAQEAIKKACPFSLRPCRSSYFAEIAAGNLKSPAINFSRQSSRIQNPKT
ncbi:hypothetical protein KI387_042351, partial [Taxus chinensis]